MNDRFQIHAGKVADRKNAASPKAAHIRLSHIRCRRRGINPQEYLTDVLQRLPSLKITPIDQLLPEHWKPSLFFCPRSFCLPGGWVVRP
ncbi:MAG: transposase domain-containing protein [Verrucomicrobia bacterium]|nr:transposase domain-containing protein [Verrucomicrobiota bacterium]